jgi:hypothetical protein
MIASLHHECVCLDRPIEVTVQFADGRYLLRHTKLQTYGVGDTVCDAILDFISSLIADLAWLTEHEDNLVSPLSRQLKLLRGCVRPVAP